MIKCALQYILEIKSNQLKSNQMLVLEERGKPENPEKNLSEQSREPTNSAHIWRRVRESNPGHIGGRRVLNHCANPAPLLDPHNLQLYCFVGVGNIVFLFVFFVLSSNLVRPCKWYSLPPVADPVKFINIPCSHDLNYPTKLHILVTSVKYLLAMNFSDIPSMLVNIQHTLFSKNVNFNWRVATVLHSIARITYAEEILTLIFILLYQAYTSLH